MARKDSCSSPTGSTSRRRWRSLLVRSSAGEGDPRDRLGRGGPGDWWRTGDRRPGAQLGAKDIRRSAHLGRLRLDERLEDQLLRKDDGIMFEETVAAGGEVAQSATRRSGRAVAPGGGAQLDHLRRGGCSKGLPPRPAGVTEPAGTSGPRPGGEYSAHAAFSPRRGGLGGFGDSTGETLSGAGRPWLAGRAASTIA
jgi:hypothetical protein